MRAVKVIGILFTCICVCAIAIGCASPATLTPAGAEPAAKMTSEAQQAPAIGTTQQAPEAKENVKPQKVAFVTLQAMSPFEAGCWDGINKALRDGYASEIKLIQLKEPSQYQAGLEQISEAGYDVIIATFEQMKPALTAVAKNHPDIKYMNVWTTAPSPEDQYPNVRGYVYNVEDGSYINGVLAAKMCKSPVGFIGSDPNAVILRFLAGYEAGIKATDPNMKLLVNWTGSSVDSAKGREIAVDMFQRGASCIMHAANQSGLGVIAEGSAEGKGTFGVDVDQSIDHPDTIISSALANQGQSCYDTIRDAATGKWTYGTIYYGADDGVPIVAINLNYPGGIPADALKAAKDAQAALASGAIKAPETTTTK